MFFSGAADARVYPILTFAINNNFVSRFFYSVRDMGIYIHNLILFERNTVAFILFIPSRTKKKNCEYIKFFYIRFGPLFPSDERPACILNYWKIAAHISLY